MRSVLKTFTQNNFLFLAIVIFLFGAIAVNLWILINSQPQTAPIKELTAQNITPPKYSFGEVLAEATKAASQSQVSQITGKAKIAILGDSMVETLGDLANLKLSLNQFYPQVEFTLQNFGVGATNPTQGLTRLTQSTKTATKQLPPLLAEKPDLVILESFAYNHGKNTPEDITAHYQTLKKIVDSLLASNIQVVFLVTIAPSQNYANGAPGILWDENQKQLEAKTVLNYLAAGIQFAKNEGLIFIDCFIPSLAPNGFGKTIYINQTDNIHPSQEGIELISDLAAQKIAKEKVVEKILTP